MGGLHPGIPTDQTLDATVCEYPGSRACPLAQGESLTVTSALGTRVAKVTHPTESRGAAPLAMCGSTKSTVHEGVLSTLDAPTFQHHDMRDLAMVLTLGVRVAEKTYMHGPGMQPQLPGVSPPCP